MEPLGGPSCNKNLFFYCCILRRPLINIISKLYFLALSQCKFGVDSSLICSSSTIRPTRLKFSYFSFRFQSLRSSDHLQPGQKVQYYWYIDSAELSLFCVKMCYERLSVSGGYGCSKCINARNMQALINTECSFSPLETSSLGCLSEKLARDLNNRNTVLTRKKYAPHGNFMRPIGPNSIFLWTIWIFYVYRQPKCFFIYLCWCFTSQ